MGSVHFGRLIGPFGFARTVAIKRLRRDLSADPDFVNMLIDEARLTSRIHHPHVVATLDTVVENDELFLVMEYVAGESLSHALRTEAVTQNGVPLPVALAVLAGVLHGLHAAHEATDERGHPLGVVHRDVSPENILIGVDGFARVLDFGIAKASARVQQATAFGNIKGKFRYVAPEQWLGAQVTRLADVYAAGLVLWYMVAGQHPFQDADGASAPFRALAGVSTPPSMHVDRRRRPLRDDERELLWRVDRVVMRALELDPRRRFSTAREMALALEALAPAPQSEVGTWLQTVAASALSRRLQRVHEIEAEASRAQPRALVKASPPTSREPAAPRAPLPRRLRSPRPGDTAPEIDATTTTGRRLVLSRSRSRYTVLFFFPKAFARDCILEAGLFRDNYAEMILAGATVLGVSADNHETQRNFAASVMAPFPMVADADGSICRAYDVLWPLLQRPKRVTFIVERSMRILAVFRHELRVSKHRDDVLLFLDERARARRRALVGK